MYSSFYFVNYSLYDATQTIELLKSIIILLINADISVSLFFNFFFEDTLLN